MTDKQVKQRWIDIKKTIKSRPLLAYIVGIPFEKWNEYMGSTPTDDEVNRIYDVIRADRTSKTERIKVELQKVVGYREAKIFAKKMRVSDTTIRDIVESKKITAGYEVIDRIEVFISVVNPDFDLSVENPLTKELLIKDEFEEIISEIRSIAQGLLFETMELSEVAKKMKAKQDWNGDERHPTTGLKRGIERLQEVKETVEALYSTYIEA